jgi:glycosyltransferase involved in cell wall biosynthesis
MSGDLQFQKKPKILIFIRNYLPGFRSGGPVRSVANIVKALSSEYEFYVVCLNRDYGVNEPYPNIAQGKWTVLGETHVYYADDGELSFSFYRKILHEVAPDFIYLNSLLDRDFSIKPFIAAGRGREISIILAPRGELSVGALGLKAFRKNLFIALVKAIKFYKYVTWHASSIGEQERILRIMSPASSQIFHASNLPTISNDRLSNREKRTGALRIVLAARISLMKNTHAAIRIAGKLQGDIELDLWGPLEDAEYWKKCQEQIRLCPPNVKVQYWGEATHEKLQILLHEYDVFLLPTLGENFGHSIIEAMSVGMPVVISNRTPWKNLKDAGVGADLPIENEAAFIKQLEDYLDMDETRFDMVRNSCRQYVATWTAESINLDSYRHMFKRVTIFGVDDNLTFKNHH